MYLCVGGGGRGDNTPQLSLISLVACSLTAFRRYRAHISRAEVKILPTKGDVGG